MEKEIVILTRDSWRHDYIRNVFGLAPGVKVLRAYCETSDDDLLSAARAADESVRVDHLERRERSEHDYFGPFVNQIPDRTNPVEIPEGSINDQKHYEEIVELEPDLLVAYGCSIIENPLLAQFKNRFLNLHLGLSPYYRGTGTNFWPLVNGEPEHVGATFMYLDEEVDTGEIIHQLRARVHPGDGPHDIGHRLIADAGQLYPEVIRKFGSYESTEPLEADNERYYTSADYSTEATEKLYENFEKGLVETYLTERENRIRNADIVKNPSIDERGVLTEPVV